MEWMIVTSLQRRSIRLMNGKLCKACRWYVYFRLTSDDGVFSFCWKASRVVEFGVFQSSLSHCIYNLKIKIVLA